jgi:heme-degrading monooxygenase HmoA
MRAMICRIWHGRTPRSKAVAYTSFLVKRALPDYRSVEGNIDVEILRWDDGEVTHFLTVTHWDSEDVIRAFAGEDLLKAKYYPEDRDFLLEFEPTVQHYVVYERTSMKASAMGVLRAATSPVAMSTPLEFHVR